RRHHSQRAPDHQRPASQRAGPGPVGGGRLAGGRFRAPHRHRVRTGRRRRRAPHRRPLRDRLLPHPAGIAQQRGAPCTRHQGQDRLAAAGRHADHDDPRQRRRHAAGQPQPPRLVRPGRHRRA
ncbi:hypothetical protein LTR94_034462, partial [Friedmanniomyces endolithicus]